MFQISSEVMGRVVGFGGQVGLVAFRLQSMAWVCWNRLAAGSLPAGWLEKMRQVGVRWVFAQVGWQPEVKLPLCIVAACVSESSTEVAGVGMGD